jgi:hypothetical protein
MRNGLCQTIVAAVLTWWLVPAGDCRAQGISLSWQEYDKAILPGAVVPYQQEPFAHRYQYYAGPAWYLSIGERPSKWAYLDYIDRVERAEKFGYRIPAPPCGWVPVYSRPRCP